MKKIFLSGLLLFAAAATLSNCSKDETTDLATTSQTTISATVEEPTRTMLDGEQVKWMANDKILLANANGLTAAYTLTADGGAGTTSGIFSGNDLGAGDKFALYPYSATATCAGGKFSFEMPATQAYAAKTFGNGANPMIAQSDANGVLNFQNMCGVIKLTLKGTQKVGKIVVTTATTAEKLSGSATVAFDADGLPVLTMDEAANIVTLNCNNTQLDAATVTSFYVVVPAATYTAGLQFMIYDETGAHINSLITSKELIVTRSQVAPLSEKTIAATLHFPDANFRAALVDAYGLKLTADLTDIDVKDVDNQAKFTSTPKISVGNQQIASLKGIEYFTGLNELFCQMNKLKSLDVSQNTALTTLDVFNNRLTSLDISNNTALTTLNCFVNPLESLDVSKNTKLTVLYCWKNELTSLDVSQNTALTILDCSLNQLTSLDLSQNTKLTQLWCYENRLTSLDVSKNTALTELRCYENQLTSLDFSQNTELTNLRCENNKLTSLDVSKNTALIYLDCGSNKLPSLNVSQNTALTRLDCGENQLPSLDINNNTKLTDFYCDKNQLTSLDVSKNTALTRLNCGENQLPSLNVIQNTALYWLYCDKNQLPSLNLSQNWRLEHLGCDDNQLTSLDLSQNKWIKSLYCDRNQLTSLDLSQNKKLTDLYCYNNQLTSLDIQPQTSLTYLLCGQQLAGGAVAPSYSELKLYMTQTQFNKNLGTGDYNDHVTRVVPVGK